MSTEEQQHIRDLHAAITGDRSTIGSWRSCTATRMVRRPARLGRGRLHASSCRSGSPKSRRSLPAQASRQRNPPRREEPPSPRPLARAFVSEHGIGLLPRKDQGGPGGPPRGWPSCRRKTSTASSAPWPITAGRTAIRPSACSFPTLSGRVCERAHARDSRQLERRPQPEQMQIVFGWLRETAATQFDERLAEFFETTLNEKQRDVTDSTCPVMKNYAGLAKCRRKHSLSKQMKPGQLLHQRHGEIADTSRPASCGPARPPRPPPDGRSCPAAGTRFRACTSFSWICPGGINQRQSNPSAGLVHKSRLRVTLCRSRLPNGTLRQTPARQAGPN